MVTWCLVTGKSTGSGGAKTLRVPERCSGRKQYDVEDIIMLLQWTTI